MEDYDAQWKVIREYNKPILDQFGIWLIDSKHSPKTVGTHVENVDFFSTFLVSNEEPLKRLDETDQYDIRMFLSFWFQRKAMWSSVESTKRNMSSFTKFYKWMGQTDQMSADSIGLILKTLKEERNDFIAAAKGG